MAASMPDRHLLSRADYARQALEGDDALGHSPGMENLRTIRKQKGLTQAQLADLVGVNQATISKIENGSENVTLDMIRRIAAALNVSAGDLFPHGELVDRLVLALRRMAPERQAAAVVVIEAMAGD